MFEVEIVLDTTRKAVSTGFLFEQNVPLYRSDEKITGQVLVTAPLDCTVSHAGVSVELESSIQFYESLNSVPLVADDAATAVVEASGAGSVKGTAAYRFELDLAKIKVKQGPLTESYDGQKFDVRHSLLVTVKRPWYTFNVSRVQAIAVQTVSPAPPTDEQARQVPMQLGVVSREAKIVVDDCGGVCTLTYPRSHWNIGDTLLGTLEFSPLTRPIHSVKLILYKIEVADGDTEEKSVRELDVVSLPVTASGGNEGGGDVERAAESGPVKRTEPVKGQETLHVAFVLQGEKGVQLSPTYDELNDAESPLNVHYYLRLLLENDNGDRFWNTHEVIMYRSNVTGVSDVDHV